MSDVLSFGDWVRKRRQALLLSRADLAQRVGVAEVTIRKIEADERKPSRQVAALLAVALQLDPADHEAFVRAARAEFAYDCLAPPTAGVPLPAFVAASTPPGLAPTAAAVPQEPLPSGTVTFLFSDIAGSARLWELHPAAMRNALARHDAILREAVTRSGGVVFKTVGDAFHAAFARTPAALDAALAAQRSLLTAPWTRDGLPEPLRVRIALHAGTAEPREGDYLGAPLNRVARLRDAAHGGQVLLSSVVYQLLADHLPPDVTLRDLGSHRLKDLSRPDHLYQMVAPGLPDEFPAPRTLDARPGNLPAQATALIGRERELAHLIALLREPHTRLVTLTGPGGTGKTRLALQIAAELADDYADGAWFIDLSPLSDPSLVASTVAHTLGMPEHAGRSPADAVVAFLRARELLLVLDNYEHVLAAAGLVAAILAGAPRVRVLVTSRVPLQLYGEREVAVAPLDLPTQGTTEVARLTQYDAVKLFIERAQAARTGFEVTSANAPAVAEICARLDGLPLALELAAARLKLFSPDALLAQLAASGRLPVLTSGARNLPARQQTIRNTIAWSFNLLSDAEKAVFARLGVFAGGWTLAAAEAVAGEKVEGRNVERGKVEDGSSFTSYPASTTPHETIAGLLESLAAHSLIKVGEGVAGEPRFNLLETIREFALEQLRERGELEATRQRHAGYILALAETAEPELRSHDQIVWLDRVEAEIDNVREAMRWALDNESFEIAARIGAALNSFWLLRDHMPEGQRWLDAVYAQRSRLTQRVRARLCHAMALICFRTRNCSASDLHEESMQLYQELGDPHAAARVGVDLGFSIAFTDVKRARVLLEHGLAVLQPAGDRLGAAWALFTLGLIAGIEADLEQKRALLEQSLALWRATGERQGIAHALLGLGDTALAQGNIAAARAYNQERLQFERELGHKEGEIASLQTLAEIAVVARQYDEAIEHSRRAEQIAANTGMEWEAVESRMNRAWLALRAGDVAHATELARQSLNELRCFDRTLRYAWLATWIGHFRLVCGAVSEASVLLEEACELNRTLGGDTRNDPFSFGCVAYHRGDLAGAQTLFEQDLILMRESGNPLAIADTLTWLGRTLTARGMPEAGLPHLRESISLLPHYADLAASALEALATCFAALGDQTRAARLWGAAAIKRERLQFMLWPVDRPAYERDIAACRAALGDAAFDEAWQAGQALTWDQAVAAALAV